MLTSCFQLQSERTDSSGYVNFTASSGLYLATRDPTLIRAYRSASPSIEDRGFATYITRGTDAVDPAPLGPLHYLNQGVDGGGSPSILARKVLKASWTFRVGTITATGGVTAHSVGIYYTNVGTTLDPIPAGIGAGDFNLGTLIQTGLSVSSGTSYTIDLPAGALSLIETAPYLTMVVRNSTSLSLAQSSTIPIDETRSYLRIFLGAQTVYQLGG